MTERIISPVGNKPWRIFLIDSVKRSLSKAASWKVIGFLVLSGLAYLVTGSVKETSVVSVTYHIIMLLLFIFHERFWNKIKWGKTRGIFIQMTGMSGAGKTTIAKNVEKRLKTHGIKVEIIDGDEYRENLCKDLGFSREDREENIRRLSFVGQVLGRNNVVCIMSAINPYETTRQYIKNKIPYSKLVYIDCNLEELKKRDTKGLYERALLPDEDEDKVYNFTGISDPFDTPACPDLSIKTDEETVEQSIIKLEKFILKNIGK